MGVATFYKARVSKTQGSWTLIKHTENFKNVAKLAYFLKQKYVLFISHKPSANITLTQHDNWTSFRYDNTERGGSQY